MSGFKTHALSGAGSGFLVATGIGYITGRIDVAVTFWFFVFVGSILPDIDTGSIPSRVFSIATVIIAGIFIFKGMDRHAAITGILNAVMRIDKHRGFMHSLLLVIILLIIGAMGCFGKIHMYYSVLAPLSFGMFVHIVMVDREY